MDLVQRQIPGTGRHVGGTVGDDITETVEAVKNLIQTGMPERMMTGYKLAYK